MGRGDRRPHRDGEQGILGVMMESFLKGGHQKPAP